MKKHGENFVGASYAVKKTRNKIATGGGQEKTLKGIYELQEQHLT